MGSGTAGDSIVMNFSIDIFSIDYLLLNIDY